MRHWGRAKTRTQQNCDVDAIVGCSLAEEEEEEEEERRQQMCPKWVVRRRRSSLLFIGYTKDSEP